MKYLLIIFSATMLSSCQYPVSFSAEYQGVKVAATLHPRSYGKQPVEVQK